MRSSQLEPSEERFIKELRAIEGVDLDPEELKCLSTLSSFEKVIARMLNTKMTEIHEAMTKPSLKLKGVIRLHLYTKFVTM